MSYSIGLTGASTRQQAGVKTLTIDDSVAGGPNYGGFQGACTDNTQFLCKRPDGSQGYYTFDAERSNPAIGLVYLKPV